MPPLEVRGSPRLSPQKIDLHPDIVKEMVEIQDQFRVATRDAVNRATRKPFYWGGLKGYRQLESIAHALHTMPATENSFFGRLIR